MSPQTVKHVAIVGTGMIGAAMATLFTGNGIKTTMVAINNPAAGRQRYDANMQDLVDKGLVTDAQADICRRYLNVTRDFAAIEDAEVVLECVVEKLELKYEIYAKIEAACTRLCAIASTTSAISADDLCQKLADKSKLLVAHPYNPAHLVPCIEIVPSCESAPEAMACVEELFRRVGHAPVVMQKSAPGFIANRLQHALFREAAYMVEAGIASPETIDEALRTSFMPRYTSIGIFEHFDYAGLDMIVSIEDYLFPTLCNADKTQDLVRRHYEKGELGYKTGQGVYDWSKKDVEDFRSRSIQPYLRYFNWALPEA